jgi:glycosyltransferase involved in cell wall biosynthesis
MPLVSVIVPAWNVAPWIGECLDSVVAQSIGTDRLELLVVDDGSTDDTGAILDDYAARFPWIRVVHQPNSGGPGAPRNAGLDRATGRYVFFLDADDYLGVEALERLVAMAERNGSDIVLGRMVGVDGRRVYRRVGAYRENVDRADPLLVYPSGNVLKLFRRSFVERAGLRFPEGIAGGEDGDLMARAYLEAGVISVVADYPCYYVRSRPGSQTTRLDRHDDIAAYVERVERNRIAPVAARHRLGPYRDAHIVRHMMKIAAKYRAGWAASDPAARHRAFVAGAAIAARWASPLVIETLPRWAALRTWCLAHGLEAALVDIASVPPARAYRQSVVEGDHVFAGFPHFRDGTGIPDRCFDIARELSIEQRLDRAALVDGRLELAGQAYLQRLGGTTTIELRRWPRGERLVVPTEVVPTPQLRDRHVRYRTSGFRATIDPRTVAGGGRIRRGSWTIRLVVGTPAVQRAVAVRAPRRGGAVPRDGRRSPGLELAVMASGELRLRVGRPNPVSRTIEGLDGLLVRAVRLGRRAARRVSRGTRIGRMLAAVGATRSRNDVEDPTAG